MLIALLFFFTARVELQTPSETVLLNVSIPETQKEAELGLSKHRTLLKEDGMLFVHPNEDYHPFTMEKTSIPLLFLFFDASFNLIEVQRAKAFQKRLVIPDKPCKYVIEAHSQLFSDSLMKRPKCSLRINP